MNKTTRREFLSHAVAFAAATATEDLAFAAADPAAPYRTPYKYPHLILSATGRQGDFDQRGIDDPIVFRANGAFQMLYIGWDGVGYQTGLATSTDLLQWKRTALVGRRDPGAKYTKYNLAISSILRDKQMHSPGNAIKVNGKYLAAWNAYPNAGYEEGAAVIGLATSSDLLHWQLGDPILRPEDGADWERGGLYRPDLLLDRGTYYLYYNAKTANLPASEDGGWREQTGVATSKDLKTWVRYAHNPSCRTGPEGAPLILRLTPSRKSSRLPPTLATAALPRIPTWCRTAPNMPCFTTAFATNVRAEPVRCWPWGPIHLHL